MVMALLTQKARITANKHTKKEEKKMKLSRNKLFKITHFY